MKYASYMHYLNMEKGVYYDKKNGYGTHKFTDWNYIVCG